MKTFTFGQDVITGSTITLHSKLTRNRQWMWNNGFLTLDNSQQRAVIPKKRNKQTKRVLWLPRPLPGGSFQATEQRRSPNRSRHAESRGARPQSRGTQAAGMRPGERVTAQREGTRDRCMRFPGWDESGPHAQDLKLYKETHILGAHLGLGIVHITTSRSEESSSVHGASEGALSSVRTQWGWLTLAEGCSGTTLIKHESKP